MGDRLSGYHGFKKWTELKINKLEKVRNYPKIIRRKYNNIPHFKVIHTNQTHIVMLLKLLVLLVAVTSVLYVIVRLISSEINRQEINENEDLERIINESENVKNKKESLKKDIDSIKKGLDKANNNLNN